MKPDLATLKHFRECRDLAMVAPELTDDDRKAQAQRVAEQAARDDAARAGAPQLPLGSEGQ